MPPVPNKQAPKRHAIVYYSRDGHTERLARQLADRLDADLFQISTARYMGRILGFLSACYDSLTGRLPEIAPIPNLSTYASVSLGAPIWTSYPATPLRAFLETHPKLPNAVGMFTTSGGTASQDKAFAMARALAGHPFVATLNVANASGTPETIKRVSDYCEALISTEPAADPA